MNSFYKSLLIILSLPFVSSIAHAENDRWGFGIYTKAGQNTLNDPAGSTGSTFGVGLGVKGMLNTDQRGSRFFASLDASQFTLDASESGDVNADVSNLQVAAGYEKRLNFSRNFKLWIGGALSVNSVDVSNRFSITQDGFLDQTYRDRSESTIGFQLNADSYFNITTRGDYQVGIGAFADVQGGDAITAFGLRLTVQNL